MNIIEHGTHYKIGDITCSRCSCVFSYNLDDVLGYDEIKNNQKIHITQVICPECNLVIETDREITELNNEEPDENNNEDISNDENGMEVEEPEG